METPTTGGAHQRTILLVDDDPANLSALNRLLQPYYDILAAPSGERALEVAAGTPKPDLILLDVVMPGSDGFEICRRIKENPATHEIPIIFLTGLDGADDEERGLSLGADDFIRKPFSAPVVLARVRNHLALAHANRLLRDRNDGLEGIVAERTAALRESEARLRGVTNSLTEGVMVVNRDGLVTFANPSAARLLDGASGLEGRTVETVFTPTAHGQALPPDELPWRRTVRDGATVCDDDATFVPASGKALTVAYACAPLVEDGATPSAAVISFRDIGLLKQAQREAQQMERLASIGQLAAGIAHEINTPIQYIGDNLRFIGTELDTLMTKIDADALAPHLREELPQAVRESLDGVAQIARIVQSTKEFSYPNSEAKTDTDINRALDTVLTVSRNAWKYVAEIRHDFDPSLPLVACHAGEMNQVFMNLIVNAAHAIEASGKPQPGRIAITTRTVGNWVEIEVADTGTGVPEALRGRIFDPFFTTKPLGKGTGQGLAICHDVVTVKHGGSIAVNGDEGEGAVFTIRLPLDGDPRDGVGDGCWRSEYCRSKMERTLT